MKCLTYKQCYMVLLSMFLLISGCSSQEKQAAEKTDVKNRFDENGDQSFWSDSLSNIRRTKKGYYFFENDKLYFMDEESMKPILFCAVSDCKHEDEKCNGYFGVYGKDLSKGFYTNALFSTQKGLYTIGYEIAEVTDLFLYKVSKDGSKRKKVGYLTSIKNGDNFSCNYTMYKEKLYKFDTNKKCLEQINLSNAKSKTIWDLSGKHGVTLDTIRGEGNYLYFDVSWYEDKKKLSSGLYRYNLQENKKEKVVDDFICNSFQIIGKEHILYMDLNYNLNIYTITTGKEKQIRKSDGNFGEFSCDGQYLYYWGNNSKQVEVYSLDGKKIEDIAFPYTQCYFGDSGYLFADGCDENAEKEEKGILLAYFDKNQIGTGKQKWKYVKQPFALWNFIKHLAEEN